MSGQNPDHPVFSPGHNRSALIHVMERAARKAARHLVRDFGEVQNLQVSRKGPGDFVTSADLRAQEILCEELARARPEYGFLCEEGNQPKIPGAEARWIIDPLDGTLNFMHAIPHFCISIALENRGELVAGLILDPLRDELFHAEVGTGAFMNRQRLRVSSRRELSTAIVAMSDLAWRALGDSTLANGGGDRNQDSLLGSEIASLRVTGSAALDLAWLAAGRLDGVWCEKMMPWDVAAGILITKEAGGFIHAPGSRQPSHLSSTIIGANAFLGPTLSMKSPSHRDRRGYGRTLIRNQGKVTSRADP